jgi:hypothetical protein
MKTHEFIQKNIGAKVYVTGDRDLAINQELRKIIFNKTELTIVKLTRGGMAYLTDNNNNFYTVPPRNVREVGN